MYRLGLQICCSRLKQSILENIVKGTGVKAGMIENAAVCNNRCWTCQPMQARWLLTSCCFRKSDDRRSMLASMPKEDEGVDGERSIDIDSSLASRSSMFPDENTPNLIFDGVRFAELPICHIKSSPNNTIMLLTDHKGEPLIARSCGMEGFKNAKKGTNIAAQATAITLSMKALKIGIKTIRVKVRGLGPGRMASIKGLEMGGMKIVSISDNTPVPLNNYPRPRKQRRV